MSTVNSDSVVRVTLAHQGIVYPRRWYYNLGEREAIKRCKQRYNLERVRGVLVKVN